MLKPLILVGSRNNITDVVYTAQDCGYEIVGILDSHYWGNTESIDGVPVIGSEQEILDSDCKWNSCDFFLADWWDGSQDLSGQGQDGGALRQKRIQLLEDARVNVINLIHPTAEFFHRFDTVKMGKGNLILGHSIFISHITIGNYSVVDWRCNIGTGTQIGNNVIVGATTTTAHTIIGDNVRIGVGCICLNRKKDYTIIGANSIIYVGSLVIQDIPENSVYTMHGRMKSRIRTTISTKTE